MLCEPVIEHVSGHPESSEDLMDLADDLLTKLHTEAKFLEPTIRESLERTLCSTAEPNFLEMKRDLEKIVEACENMLNIKLAYKPLWPSNETANQILSRFRQGSEAPELSSLRLKLRSLNDDVAMATKPLHAPQWVSAVPRK